MRIGSIFIRALFFWMITLCLLVDVRAISLNCTFVDDQGKALRNVEIRLTPVGAEAYQFKQTSKTGQADFRNLTAGSFELRAQLKEHMPLKREITISADQTLSLTLMTLKEFHGLEQKAEQAFNARDFSKALGIYEKLLATYPDDPTLHFNLARIYAALLQEDKAVAEVEKAGHLHPEFNDRKIEIERYVLLQQGQSALQSLDFKKAIDSFSKLISMDPKNAQAYYGLALAYGHQENYKEALGAINKALELDPQNKDYMNVKTILEKSAGSK
jgi:Flp pilus assembly protein TadD